MFKSEHVSAFQRSNAIGPKYGSMKMKMKIKVFELDATVSLNMNIRQKLNKNERERERERERLWVPSSRPATTVQCPHYPLLVSSH